MIYKSKIRPTRTAYLIDIAVILIISILAVIEREYTTQEYYLDWLNLLYYIPFYVAYGLFVTFFRMYRKNRRVSQYVTQCIVGSVILAVVWALFFYKSLPSTEAEKSYEQFKQNQIILTGESSEKIHQWVDVDHLNASSLIDSCKVFHAEQREERKSSQDDTQYLLEILFFLLSNLTVFAAVTAIHFMFLMMETENERQEAEKLKAEAELKLLKYQLNPHFLMNTLNNIHALIELDTEEAQKSVRLLSQMMRYMLYESNLEKVELKKEIQFLSIYFEMMKKRYIDTVPIDFIVPDEIPNVQIPPALFINLAENAFKHGITYDSNAFLRFELVFSPDSISCLVSNSKITNGADIQESFGFGIESLQKRLDLIYPKQYTYKIQETDNEYNVELTIPIL